MINFIMISEITNLPAPSLARCEFYCILDIHCISFVACFIYKTDFKADLVTHSSKVSIRRDKVIVNDIPLLEVTMTHHVACTCIPPVNHRSV